MKKNFLKKVKFKKWFDYVYYTNLHQNRKIKYYLSDKEYTGVIIGSKVMYEGKISKDFDPNEEFIAGSRLINRISHQFFKVCVGYNDIRFVPKNECEIEDNFVDSLPEIS